MEYKYQPEAIRSHNISKGERASENGNGKGKNKMKKAKTIHLPAPRESRRDDHNKSLTKSSKSK